MIVGYFFIAGVILMISMIGFLSYYEKYPDKDERNFLRGLGTVALLSPVWPLLIVVGIVFLAKFILSDGEERTKTKKQKKDRRL